MLIVESFLEEWGFQAHLLADVHSLRQIIWLFVYLITNSLDSVLTWLEMWFTKNFLGKPERLEFWKKNEDYKLILLTEKDKKG